MFIPMHVCLHNSVSDENMCKQIEMATEMESETQIDGPLNKYIYIYIERKEYREKKGTRDNIKLTPTLTLKFVVLSCGPKRLSNLT